MTIQAPGYQAISQETSRVLTRGKLEFFNYCFFYDDAKTQPVQSLDPQSYPSYRITTPSGDVLAQGVAVVGGTPGYWRIGWVVPKAAELTNVHRRYRFQSVMVDTESRQFEVSYEFDVVESNIPAQNPELQQLITMVGMGIRVSFNSTVRPDYLQLVVCPRANDTNILHQASLTYPIPATPASSDLREVQNGTGYAYYSDVPALPSPGEYSVKWLVRDTTLSPMDFEHQAMVVVTSNMMFMVRSLRMIIDKLQKKLGLVFAYTNEDLIEYLNEGTALINGYWPPTNMTPENANKALSAFIILASAWWGLSAQRILYGETNLDFCVDLETLLPTPRGLIRAKDLILDESIMLRRRICSQLFDTICDRFGANTRGQEIVDTLELPNGSISLGVMFTRFRLNEFKSFTPLGKPVWNIPEFRHHLQRNYGMFYYPEEGCYKTEHKLLTPNGFDTPEQVWFLKNKQVHRMENELGYELIATGNHPILTLDTTTFETNWKDLDKIENGDLVALNVASVAEEEDWEVSLVEHVKVVKDTNTVTTQSFFDLPEKLTPELARLMGYLVAEGCSTQYDCITFSNTDQRLIDDFNHCCTVALGKPATYIESKTDGSFSTEDSPPVHYYQLYGTELRRFFFALGVGYEKSKSKFVPDLILKAPKRIAKEFVRSFFEGDGCFADDNIIFSSSSRKLLNDFQQLFLRFGIVTKKKNPTEDVVGYVKVRGLSLVRYAEEIGFLFKGLDFKEKTKYFPQIEALSPDILHGLIKLRQTLGINSKGWKDTPEGKKRYSVYWNHNAKATHGQCQNITWEHVDSWFSDRGEAIRELNPEMWARIKQLLDTRFLWKKVSYVEKLGRRDVVDPSFVSHGSNLDHAFVTNGLITHNSGQTVTLGYNPAAEIESAINSYKETLDTHVSATKKNLMRWASSVGSISTRPYRYRTNQVFPISFGSGAEILQTMVTLGILD